MFVPTISGVTVFDGALGDGALPPTVVGDAPQYGDDSDATYAQLWTSENPLATTIDRSSAVLAQVHVSLQAPQIVCRVRYMNEEGGMHPPRIRITDASGIAIMQTNPSTVPGSTVVTWIDILMEPLSLGASALPFTLDLIRKGNARLGVDAPSYPGLVDREVWTRVYEAFLVIPAMGGAPACRKHPADTEGSVGGPVRKFPPSKSRQRSNRGVGYY